MDGGQAASKRLANEISSFSIEISALYAYTVYLAEETARQLAMRSLDDALAAYYANYIMI